MCLMIKGVKVKPFVNVAMEPSALIPYRNPAKSS